jgi:hypothetical protein
MTVLFILAVGLLPAAVIVGRRTAPTTEDNQRLVQEKHGLQAELKTAQENYEYSQKVVGWRDNDVAQARKERDQYKAIAVTHEVKLPEPPGPTKLRRVWSERFYRGLPDANLKGLAEDLKQFEGQELHLEMHVRGRGGWKKIIGEKWTITKRVSGYNRQVPADYIGPTRFQGTVSRVIEEIGIFLRDDDTGLVTKGGPGKGKWRDKDSALKFEIDLCVKGATAPPPMPEVHTVEVAVVEERVIERIIEKPVVLSIPAGSEADLCGHTKEEIVGLIEAVLDVRSDTRGVTAKDFEGLTDQVVETAAEQQEIDSLG